jgi:uncharacterized protein YfaP (DUF2135 family)
MLLSMIALSMAAAQCSRAELPRPLAGWTRSGRTLDTRHAVTLPARSGRVETGIRIRSEGVFGIALDREGWIDVAPQGGGKLRVVSESRGPRCSGIAKIVRYRLKPGSYRVTVVKLQGTRAKLMLVHGGIARGRRRG